MSTTNDDVESHKHEWVLEAYRRGEWVILTRGSLDECLGDLYLFRDDFSRQRIVAPFSAVA